MAFSEEGKYSRALGVADHSLSALTKFSNTLSMSARLKKQWKSGVKVIFYENLISPLAFEATKGSVIVLDNQPFILALNLHDSSICFIKTVYLRIQNIGFNQEKAIMPHWWCLLNSFDH